ncbi:hypothetical protein AAC387_Pa07g1288 [Persea americana]
MKSKILYRYSRQPLRKIDWSSADMSLCENQMNERKRNPRKWRFRLSPNHSFLLLFPFSPSGLCFRLKMLSAFLYGSSEGIFGMFFFMARQQIGDDVAITTDSQS